MMMIAVLAIFSFTSLVSGQFLFSGQLSAQADGDDKSSSGEHVPLLGL